MVGESLFWIKAGGAAIGSSIAVVFKPGGDPIYKLLTRFVLGMIIGFIMAPIVIDGFNWTHTPDYWLAAATLSGLLGYLFLQLLFSDASISAIKRRIRG